MSFRRFILCVFALYAVSLSLFSQTNSGNAKTLKYKVGTYDVKTKSQTVITVAEKLKVDPLVIQKLNKFKKVNQALVKGQRIKIPVYPKGYKYEPETVVVHKPVSAEGKSPELIETPQPLYDSIRDRNRLLFVDAMLELNEAMMEGVKASLDSFNVKEETIINEKNMNVTLQNMKRNRDRALLKPYIEHIGDSLTYEIKLLKAEKQGLEARLKLSAPVSITIDTVVSGTDTIVYRIAAYSDRPDERTVISVKVMDEIALKGNSPQETKENDKRNKKGAESYGIDTVIIYDLPSSTANRTELKPEPEVRQMSKEGMIEKPKWDTARAMPPVTEHEMVKTDTTATFAMSDPLVVFKVTAPGSTDSIIIKPVAKSKAPKPVAFEKDSSVTTSKGDTIAKAIVTESKTQRESPLSNLDSIRRIKAEFFLKRARKSMAEKNLHNAELYVKKSIELFPRYFDAWFTLAEVEDLSGSPQSALKEYKVCEGIDSTRYDLYLSMGNVYTKLKRKTEAFAAYEKSIKLNNDNIPALMERAAILTDWKRYDDAIRDYDTVLSINRIYHYAYKARGQVKLLSKDFATAIDDFTRFLIFEETDPSAFYYRGLAKIGNNELLDGCLDLSTSSSMGYVGAEKAIKKSCE